MRTHLLIQCTLFCLCWQIGVRCIILDKKEKREDKRDEYKKKKEFDRFCRQNPFARVPKFLQISVPALHSSLKTVHRTVFLMLRPSLV